MSLKLIQLKSDDQSSTFKRLDWFLQSKNGVACPRLVSFLQTTGVVAVQPPVKITCLLWIMTLSPNRPYTIIHFTSTVRPTHSSHVDCPIHSIHATLYWPHIAAINHCLRIKFLCLSLIRHSPSWKGHFQEKRN